MSPDGFQALDSAAGESAGAAVAAERSVVRRLRRLPRLPAFARRRAGAGAPGRQVGERAGGVEPGAAAAITGDSARDFAGLEALARHRRRIGAVLTLGLAVAMMAVFAAVQPVVIRFVPRARWWLPPFWYRSIGWLTGMRLACVGAPVQGPALFVSNHVSWLDILVLGAALRRAAFISKQEVRAWGIFGRCAELAHSVFIDRRRRGESARQRDLLRDRLARGDRLILFAEGTSTDGTGVLPFKSALFAVAELDPDLPVQPISLCYTHVNGVPVARADRPQIGWFGDMELISHVISLMGLGRIRAELRFHPPITLAEAGSRKALARYCERVIRNGLAAARKERARKREQKAS